MLGLGVGASIAVGMTGEYLFKALEAFVPGQIKGILPLKKIFPFLYWRNFSFSCWKITRFICSRKEGVMRAARFRFEVGGPDVSLPNRGWFGGNVKIRKKQLFGNDVTREDTLLFKPKTAKQMLDSCPCSVWNRVHRR